MGRYGSVAVLAANMCRERTASSPIDAWKMATAKIFPSSKSLQNKACPRGAFLGLCESGLISGIANGSYCRSIKNKKYALTALAILKERPDLLLDEKSLWLIVMKLDGDMNKTPNHQMDVIISLWNAGLIHE